MALLFCDSFDHYATADLTEKWSSSANAPDIGAYGRNSTNGMRFTGANRQATKDLTSTPATVIVGHSVKFPVATTAVNWLHFRDNGTTQVYLKFNTDASIEAYNGDNTLLGTSSPGAVPSPTSVHNYIECKVTIHDSAGIVIVKVNEVVVLNLSSKDTKNTSNAYVTQINLQNVLPSGDQHPDFDDFYICDTTGSVCNDFLGDIRVEYIAPDGAGNSTQFTPSTGSNYQNVDDTAPNDDTDYNSSTTVGHTDLYTMGALASSSGSVLAVAVITSDRKDDSGTRTHQHVVRLSGTNSTGASFSPTTSYAFHQTVFETKPGGGAWTISDVNAMESGLTIAT